jgi:hypothetical protein
MMRHTILSLALTMALLAGCSAEFEAATSHEVLGLIVTPTEPVVTVGGEIQLVATAFYEDGMTADVTPSCRWTALDGSQRVQLGNGMDSEGKVLGVTPGAAQVVAEIGGVVSDTIVVWVTDAQVIGLTIKPGDVELIEGESTWLQAMAEFSDGTRGDLSAGVRWITGDPDVATLAVDGKVTAKHPGYTQVRTEYEDITSEPVAVTVIDDPVGDDDDAGDDDAGDDDAGDDDAGDDDAGDDDAGDDDAGDDDMGDDDTGDDDTSPTGMPNLEVTYFSAYVGETETYYFVDVTNTGDLAADGFYVDLFLDLWDPPVFGEDGEHYQYIDTLEPGDTVYADFDVPEIPVSYEWWSYVLLDTLEQVEESDESDNVEGPLTVE